MSCWALIALKAPAAAKGRLAEILDATGRSQLVAQMFSQVLEALQAARSIDGIAVVTAESLPQTGLVVLDDPGGGLNAALTHGARELAARGVDELLVLHADLPLLTAAQIDAFVAAGRETGLAIAPDKLGQGSNALYLPLPAPISFCFGHDSCRLHLAEAARIGRPITRQTMAGFAFDVDEPADLERLLAQEGERYGFLRQAMKLTAPAPWQQGGINA
jgi:2-phospho-L-lactate guanylyltransferase